MVNTRGVRVPLTTTRSRFYWFVGEASINPGMTSAPAAREPGEGALSSSVVGEGSPEAAASRGPGARVHLQVPRLR